MGVMTMYGVKTNDCMYLHNMHRESYSITFTRSLIRQSNVRPVIGLNKHTKYVVVLNVTHHSSFFILASSDEPPWTLGHETHADELNK